MAKTRITSVGISVAAPTTPGTLTNSGWTFGCNRTHEHGRTRRELVVAVAKHHCNGPKPYLYSRIYQGFFSKIIHPIPRGLDTSPVSEARHAFICNSGIPWLFRESSACPLHEFPRKNRCGFLEKSAAWEKGGW